MEKKVRPAVASYEIISTSKGKDKWADTHYVVLDSCKSPSYLIRILTDQCEVRITPYGVCFKHVERDFDFMPREKNNYYVAEHLKDRWLISCGSKRKAAKWLIKEARMLQAIEEKN